MKTWGGEAGGPLSADLEGQPIMGIVIGSIGALALWAAILGVISLIV